MIGNKNFMKHYKRAQAMRRGFVLFNCDEYEIHVKSMYSYIAYAGMLESNEQVVKNALRLYVELETL